MDLQKRPHDAGSVEEEDVHPQGYSRGMPMNTHQSIFSLIAAAGSGVDFNDRFEGQSSDEDETEDARMTSTIAHGRIPKYASRTKSPLFKASAGRVPALSRSLVDPGAKNPPPQIMRDNQMIEAMSSDPPPPPIIPTSSASRPRISSTLATETLTPPEDGGYLSRPPPLTQRESSVMGRMLDARAEIGARPSFDLEQAPDEVLEDQEASAPRPSPLARRLQAIYGFEQPEEVLEEYPCWLLQHALLQGYMYVTTEHIAFYAYLPKKANEVIKSGYLAKSGKRNPKYSRYWFRLKGDVLAYYHDSQSLYFPSGQIDLRYGISANITDNGKDGAYFSLVTNHRTYHFRADSAPSANEWVKSIQRVIFRSHNDGDSVKICLPIANVIDIEETQMFELADTCKIRVLDNDETYAIDEYFFSFFGSKRGAITLLRASMDQCAYMVTPDQPPKANSHGLRHCLGTGHPVIAASDSMLASEQEVKITPFFRSAEGPTGPDFHGDSHETIDSFDHALDEEGQASLTALVASGSEAPSASQILRGSDVFHGPTVERAGDSSRTPRKTPNPATINPSSDGHLSAADNPANFPEDRRAKMVSTTTASLHGLVNMTYPFQRAGALADYINRQSRRMSSLLASESMGYVEKVSGMWKGGKKHYDESSASKLSADLDDDPTDRHDTEIRFRVHFALPDSETLQATYFGYLMRVLPLYGKIYISDRHFLFRSLLPGSRTKLVLPLKDIENVDKEKGFRFGYSGLVLVIRGHEELFFEFAKADIRDDCTDTLRHGLETTRLLSQSVVLAREDWEDAEAAVAERDALREARKAGDATQREGTAREAVGPGDGPSILFDDPRASFLNFKPSTPMRITCLTIGSRGDVQPYIALCKGLIAEGHQASLATHAEFKEWIEGHGITFRNIVGDPAELMRICIQNGTFTWAFLREANSKFRGWLDELLVSAYAACKDADLLIESPSAIAGIHIAEALGIPYFRAFTMPWTRTRAYPHAFIMPDHKMGGAYNYVTYIMFDNVFWKAIASQVNRWRNNTLGLPNANLEKMQPNKVPFLYNFSPHVVPPPLDYSDWIRVTGYWFLDEGGDGKGRWTPPADLLDFITTARRDGKKLVYVGFGSIIVPDAAKMTQDVIDAVLKAGVRCVLSKGWSDRVDVPSMPPEAKADPALPREIFAIQSAPHDWLFKQMDAAAHHGGSGTTGASLRAGIPTVVRPFFGDQFFFGSRVEDLGVGVCLKKWGVNSFARALSEVTTNQRVVVKARALGEQIRSERGVDHAIQCIYRDLEYAKSLVKFKAMKNANRRLLDSAGEGSGSVDDDAAEEESWTFVDTSADDLDLEATTQYLDAREADGMSGKHESAA